MALVKGTNSYVTVDEANSYFENRLDVASWTNAEATEKAKALVTATMLLDQESWSGTAISESQALAFPRSGQYFDPRIGALKSMDPVPARILQATSELAYHLLNNDGLLDSSDGAVSIDIAGAVSLTTIQKVSSIPLFVKRIIKPLQKNLGSNMWWRAN